MKYFTKGYKNVEVSNSVSELETFTVKHGVGEDDSILSDIFAPDPVTGLPSSDLFVEANHVNDTLREYITNVLRRPLTESERLDNADDVLSYARGIDETKAEYLKRIVEITQEGS